MKKNKPRSDEPVSSLEVVDDKAYYTLIWSPLAKIDKFVILNCVPAMSGIYELYYLDNHENLVCFYISRVWYGGLRSAVREITDPLVNVNPGRKKIFDEKECYFRYTVVSSFADMRDLMNILGTKRLPPGRVPPESSGRFEELYLKEESPNKIVAY